MERTRRKSDVFSGLGDETINLESVREAVDSLRQMYEEELDSNHPHPEDINGWVAWLYADLLRALRDGRVVDPNACITEALKLDDL